MKELSEFLTLENLKSYGIVDMGLTTAPVPHTLSHYNDWVAQGKHGPLSYLEGERQDKRQDLRHYFSDFKSSLVFLFSYADTKYALNDFYKGQESNGHKIAGYVLGFNGVDYHFEVKSRLEEIKAKLISLDPELKIELSLDIQPVLERDLALRAGLGWFGKNSMLINKSEGSFLILGSLLLSKDYSFIVSEKKMETDHCGQCTRCIDACPTMAIEPESRSLIANKCISTFTIELFKEAPAPEKMESAQGEIFGCDICQDVCPWNKRVFRKMNEVKSELLQSPKNKFIIDFFLNRAVDEIISELNSLSNRAYQKLFFGTPLQRTGRVGLLKNLMFWKNLK